MPDNNIVNVDKAKEMLNSGMEKANELLKDNEQISQLVREVQKKVGGIPVLNDAVKDFPDMVSMVKGYVTKDYTNVSPKVVATIVSAFLYLTSRKDIIPDRIPILGILDDVAVLALALNFVQPEIREYQKWKKDQEKPKLIETAE